jgi:hypothetical protein
MMRAVYGVAFRLRRRVLVYTRAGTVPNESAIEAGFGTGRVSSVGSTQRREESRRRRHECLRHKGSFDRFTHAR